MHKRAISVFFGVACVYLGLSPLSPEGMGYVHEEVAACRQILAGSAVEWPRNGAVALAFQCPFVALGDAIPAVPPTLPWALRLIALQPILASALLVTMLFVWSSRLAGDARWGFAIAVVAAFGTMIWPYAYIGLETTQSLFLLLAGYLALAAPPAITWPRALALGATAGIAVSAKSGGFLLLPAVAYLLFAWARRTRPVGAPAALSLWAARVGSAVVILGVTLAVNQHFRALSWARFGGTAKFIEGWLVRDAVSPFLHLAGLVGSPNKGLLVFAPLAIVALIALPRAWSVDRPVAAFAALTFGSLAAGLALLHMWSDETWGPRYLHSALAPLFLALAASRRGADLRLRLRLLRKVPLAAAAVLGLPVSILGILFYYGTLAVVARQTLPPTLALFQGDTTWNHVKFNAKLLETWRKGPDHGEPAYLDRSRVWDFWDGKRTQVWTRVDLRPFAKPQPILLRSRSDEPPALHRWLRGVCGLALLGGLFLLARTGFGLARARPR